MDLDFTMEFSESATAAEAFEESSPKNSKDGPLKGIDEEQASNTEDANGRKSKRPYTYTEKGLQYQLSLKEKDYMQAKRKLKEMIGTA